MSVGDRHPSPSDGPPSHEGGTRAIRRTSLTPGRVLVLTSVMFTFIGYWRTAAVVLCDLASTAYYIGGIVESQIGKAAPWFILAVMLFSYAVRSVYIESCSMFVRGGVYRVVREAMGHGMAKVSVSALMFDYVLTGPISAVSAGQYLVRLLNQVLAYLRIRIHIGDRWGASGIAVAVVLYFWLANVRGIRTSSEKALKIMWATTVMAVIIIAWCLVTMAVRPETRTRPPMAPDLSPKVDKDGKPRINEVTGKQEDPLGWIADTPLGPRLRPDRIRWASLLGALGVLIAFGHSILAMSGEETLAQVYREVKAPKLRNFKRAAFIVFLYSLVLTGLVSFFAVMIIPDKVRVDYQDNLISGLALHVVGPHWARLALNTLVVVVGFMILAGAVNTSIVGANGVLNRVTEDGVLPDWFLRPQRRYGTTWRLLSLVAGLQVATIVLSGGNVIVLGEAYAFGVVWSLVFKAMSMLLLRFQQPDRYRGYRVPLNVRLGRFELPLGLALVFLVLLASALANLLTKPVATISGLSFAATFLAAFTTSEWYRKRKEGEQGNKLEHRHLEQFKHECPPELTPAALGLERPYRKVAEVGTPEDLTGLDTCLVETDPDSTEVVVVAAHPPPAPGEDRAPDPDEDQDSDPDAPNSCGPEARLGVEDRVLMTAVVHRSELAGKPVKPVVILSEEPLSAVIQAARAIGAQELVLGPDGADAPSARLARAAALWQQSADDQPAAPVTIRVLGKGVDERRDLGGGCRLPRAPDDGGETARSLAGSGTD